MLVFVGTRGTKTVQIVSSKMLWLQVPYFVRKGPLGCIRNEVANTAASSIGKRGAELQVEERKPFFELLVTAHMGTLVGFPGPHGRHS